MPKTMRKRNVQKKTRKNRKSSKSSKSSKPVKRIRFLLQKGGTSAPASYIPFESTPGQYIPVAYAPTIGATADPSDPSNVVSVRIQPNMVGGKRKHTKKNKTLRGGADPVTDVQTSNIPYSFLTTPGAQTSADVLNGIKIQEVNATNSSAFRPVMII
jgi:hypothetical protein